MTEAKHTPGPWHWVNSSTDMPYDFSCKWDGTGDPSLRTVAEKKSEFYGVTLPDFILDADPGHILENEANARLIAAAPDLLEALSDIVEAFGVEESVQWEDAYAAIAKAKGTVK